MKHPTFAIAVTFHIKANFVDSFRARILKQASDSLRLEPGCCQFDVLNHESDTSIFFLYETYVDAGAFETHKSTPHFADYDKTVAPWIESKNVERLSVLER